MALSCITDQIVSWSFVQMELWFLLGHLSVYPSLSLPFLENLYLCWKENITEDLTELLIVFLHSLSIIGYLLTCFEMLLCPSSKHKRFGRFPAKTGVRLWFPSAWRGWTGSACK